MEGEKQKTATGIEAFRQVSISLDTDSEDSQRSLPLGFVGMLFLFDRERDFSAVLFPAS